MAYGNYGGWVFRNGEHMPQWEDQYPYQEESTVAGYHLAFGQDRSEQKFALCHVVIGGKEMRLAAGKTFPRLFWRLQQVEPWDYDDDSTYPPMRSYALCGPPGRDHFGHDCQWRGEIEGYRFAFSKNDGFAELALIESDGVIWEARSGYCYGAGHDDAPPGGGLGVAADLLGVAS